MFFFVLGGGRHDLAGPVLPEINDIPICQGCLMWKIRKQWPRDYWSFGGLRFFPVPFGAVAAVYFCDVSLTYFETFLSKGPDPSRLPLTTSPPMIGIELDPSSKFLQLTNK